MVKRACPECGHVIEMGGLDQVIAFLCEGCAAGVDVEPFGGTEGMRRCRVSMIGKDGWIMAAAAHP